MQGPLGRRPNHRVRVAQRARERGLGSALAQPAQGLGGGLTQVAVRVAQNRQEQAHRQLAPLLDGGSRHLARGRGGRSLGFHRAQANQQLPDEVAHVRVPVV